MFRFKLKSREMDVKINNEENVTRGYYHNLRVLARGDQYLEIPKNMLSPKVPVPPSNTSMVIMK